MSTVAEGNREGRIACSNPACAAEVPADRARCPRCGQSLREPSRGDRLEPMARALTEHGQRFARLAGEAERVVAMAREAIDERQQSERRRLQRHLEETLEASRRAARADFDEAAARTKALAAEASGVQVASVGLTIPGTRGEKLDAPVILPLLDEGHVVLSAPEERREEALGAVAGILRAALASRPPARSATGSSTRSGPARR